MKKTLQITDMGHVSYAEAEEFQKDVLSKRLEDRVKDRLIFCEFYPVYAAGRSCGEKDLPDPSNKKTPKQPPLIQTDRGGGLTFHGPGQLVAWAVMGLTHYRKDLIWYMNKLEQAAIKFLKRYDINSRTDDVNRGIWINDKKIGFMGIGVKRWTTYHGISININNDLSYFNPIRPCGLDIDVTSIYRESGHRQSMDRAKEYFADDFANTFGITEITDPKQTAVLCP
jgi:lipoate-protein ligase B